MVNDCLPSLIPVYFPLSFWMHLSHWKACDLLVGRNMIEVAQKLWNKWNTSQISSFHFHFLCIQNVYNYWMQLMSVKEKLTRSVFWWWQLCSISLGCVIDCFTPPISYPGFFFFLNWFNTPQIQRCTNRWRIRDNMEYLI